jgi:hypothetical protein
LRGADGCWHRVCLTALAAFFGMDEDVIRSARDDVLAGRLHGTDALPLSASSHHTRTDIRRGVESRIMEHLMDTFAMPSPVRADVLHLSCGTTLLDLYHMYAAMVENEADNWLSQVPSQYTALATVPLEYDAFLRHLHEL